MNSVRGIAEIIRKANLNPDNTRVICSPNAENNKFKLPLGYTISKTSDSIKKINFYTSTCFEGQDIYDEYGQTIVVSDKYSNYTKLDISTSLIQVAGRIRNSIYKNHIVHIYAANDTKKDMSLQEYEESIKSNLETAKNNAALLNQLSPDMKKILTKTLSDNKDSYIDIVDGDIVVDENVANWNIVRYKLINGIYSSQVNMDYELVKSGFDIAKSSQLNTPALKVDSKDITKRSFKETFEEYCKLMENEPQFSLGRNLELEIIEANKPLIKEAYKVLGADKVRELKYHQSNIKMEIVKKTEPKDNLIIKLLKDKFPMQEAIPCKEIKSELKRIYKELGITRATKATDISRWYEVKRIQKKIDGKNIDCLILIMSKITFGI